jgi:hypothetical protein
MSLENLSNYDIIEIAWAAGLIEGEGTFTNKKYHKQIRVGMVDKDILVRLERIFKCGKVRYSHNTITDKPFYVWSVGKRNQVKEVCLLILPFMGERRSSKIQEVINSIGD